MKLSRMGSVMMAAHESEFWAEISERSNSMYSGREQSSRTTKWRFL